MERGRCRLLFPCGILIATHLSSSALGFTLTRGAIAQPWLERTPDKREVSGSSPLSPTILEVRGYEVRG